MIDGPVLVREALAAGVALREAFVTADCDAELVDDLASAGVEVRAVAADVLQRAADTVTPQGIAVVADRPDVGSAEAVASVPAGTLVLVLADVADPGNAGTLLRAAEAAGSSAVLFCGRSVDPCNPKCVRASAGALFHVPVASGGETVEVLGLLRDAGVATVATVVRGAMPYDTTDLTGSVAIVLGSEAHGLPAEALELVDRSVTIPMAGRAESLNVAMAGSVLCFESLRQRRSVA